MATGARKERQEGGEPPRRIRLDAVIFVLSAVVLVAGGAFAYGVAVGKYRLFPYRPIAEMVTTTLAAKDLLVLNVATDDSAHMIATDTRPGLVGQVVTVDDATRDDLILLSEFDGSLFVVKLIDRRGTVLHRWPIPFDRHPTLLTNPDTGTTLAPRHIALQGVHLYPNGDVLVVISDRRLVRLDRNGDLVWMSGKLAHHAVWVAADETIWTLSHHRRSTDTAPHVAVPYVDDELMQLSPDGEILQVHRMLDVIAASRHEGLVYFGSPTRPSVDHDDPLHTNDVKTLKESDRQRLPMVAAGDLLVSTRTNNSVMILDKDDLSIKWSLTGPFLRQHDPEFDADGFLWIYDNRSAGDQTGRGAREITEEPTFGYSRIIKVDPATREVVAVYAGTPEAPFYSSIQGRLQPLGDDRVLVVDTEAGRVLEVDVRAQRITWEYVNRPAPGFNGRITDAERYPRSYAEFLAP